MRGHVFVVDRYSWPVHRSRLFCGVKNPMNINSRLSLYADLLCVRKGDLVFFYQRRINEPRLERGFRGVFRVISPPFFHDEDLSWEGNVVLGKCPYCSSPYSEKQGKCSNPKCKKELDPTRHILPNRILIRPDEEHGYFEKPVDDNTAYINRTNHGMLWTMLFRKIFGPGRERSVTPILPEEVEKLIRLLRKVNENRTSIFPSDPYKPRTFHRITINLCDFSDGSIVKYENALMAWMTENIDKGYPVLKDIVGPLDELEYFGNNVLYGIGGEKVDLLLLHKRNGVRYKATVMELKKNKISRKAIDQIKDYSYWIAQLSTANLMPPPEEFAIQPILVGHEISSDASLLIERIQEHIITIPYQPPCKVRIYKPIVVTYSIVDCEIEFDIKEGLSKGSLLD